MTEKQFDDYRFSNKFQNNPRQTNPAISQHKPEYVQSPKYDYQPHNVLQDNMNRSKSGFLNQYQTDHVQRNSEPYASKEFGPRHDYGRPDLSKVQELSKMCQEYKEDIENEMRELQKQLGKPNERAKPIDIEKAFNRKQSIVLFLLLFLVILSNAILLLLLMGYVSTKHLFLSILVIQRVLLDLSSIYKLI